MIATKPNEDGVVFVTGKKHEYIVTYECDGNIYTRKESGRAIFHKMEMDDCYGISIVGCIIKVDGDNLTPCFFCGTWSNPKDPLKMWIEDAESGEVYDVGYAPNH